MSLPNLSEKQVESIEEMAANGFTPEEIGEVLFFFKVDQEALLEEMRTKKGLGYLSYRKGFLKSQLELRQRIFKDAKNGSSPAQMLAKKILDDAEYKMNNS